MRRVVAAAAPAFVKPQLATLKARAPSGDQWLHEIKFDDTHSGPPRQRERGGERRSSRHRETATSGQPVLVVDDESTIRHLIDEVLAEAGYTASTLWTGAPASKSFSLEPESNFSLPTLAVLSASSSAHGGYRFAQSSEDDASAGQESDRRTTILVTLPD